MTERKVGSIETIRVTRSKDGSLIPNRVAIHPTPGPFVDSDIKRRTQRLATRAARVNNDSEGFTFIQESSFPAYRKE